MNKDESGKLRTTRTLMPYMPRALRALVPHVPRALRTLVPFMLSCPTCSRALRASYLTCLLRYVPCVLRAS